VLHARPTGRIGQALLQAKIVTEEELASLLKVQVSEVIFNTFEWHQGVFAFFDKVSAPVTAVTLDIDLQNLIMEGCRIGERSRMAEAIPDRGVIVEPIANAERIKQSVTFTPNEWRVFFLVDGRRSVDEICRTVGDPTTSRPSRSSTTWCRRNSPGWSRRAPPIPAIAGTLFGKSPTSLLEAASGAESNVEFAPRARPQG
jgi:hypothetical protein